MAGAYRFVIQPGAATVVEVEASLFFRKSPRKMERQHCGLLDAAGQARQGHELHLTYRIVALLAGSEQKLLLRVRSTRIPLWRISVQRQAFWLFVAVMGLLIAPKLLGLLLHVRKREERAAFGGGGALALSVLLETAASSLLAPVLAFLQSHFVAGILLGKNVEWEAQDRGEAQTTFGEAARRHWPSTLLGAAWSVLLLATTPKLFWWFSPVLAGFLLAIPVSVWSSRVSLGQWTRQHRLFLTPEEVDPPPILLTLERELELAAARPWVKAEDGLERVLREPGVRAAHLSMLSNGEPKDELRRHYLEGLELKYRHGGAATLTAREKRDLLLDEEAIRSLLTQADGMMLSKV